MTPPGASGTPPPYNNPQGFSLPQTSAAAWGQAALHPTLPHSVGRAFARNSFTPPCRGRACPARSLPANVLRLTAAGRIYAAPAALQNKSLLHHNRCRRLLYLFKWLHGLVGCLRRDRSDCFWHGQGGSVMCLGAFPLTLVILYTAFMSALSRQFEKYVKSRFPQITSGCACRT